MQVASWHNLNISSELATFAVASLGVTVIAPYTGNPAREDLNATFMSALAFAGAACLAGVLYQGLRAR